MFMEREHRMICNSFQKFIQSFTSGLHKLLRKKKIQDASHHKLLTMYENEMSGLGFSVCSPASQNPGIVNEKDILVTLP